MEVAERSSSNDLSSAPNSDVEGPLSGQTAIYNSSNTITVSRSVSSNHTNTVAPSVRGGGDFNIAQASATDRQDPTPKQRKPRKKKDSDATVIPAEKKEKTTRRPRGASAAAGSTRKKLKTEAVESAPTVHNVPPSIDAAYPRPLKQSVLDLSQSSLNHNEAAKYSQNGFLNGSPAMQTPKLPPPPQFNTAPPPTPSSQPPVVRSMAYDPVRSLTRPRHTEPPQTAPTHNSTLNTPPRTMYNPSTSPAISSIINPPEASENERKAPALPYQPLNEARPQSSLGLSRPKESSSAIKVEPPTVKVDVPKKTTPEAAPTKPVSKPRAKEQPPPLPTGSGLLSSTLFGGDSGMDANKSTSDKGTSIVLHIDLKNPSNKVINFARMAEDKYGFAALYPRQAAQKERLAKVAAAGAALERAGSGTKGTPAGESGDEDVSVDIDRDSDNDGDVAMSGMNGTGEAVNSGTDGPVPKRRRRKDEYDADDPFVDDSEMLWEAQAAASKDGFFVYCGPLVPEGEKPTVERADGTVKRGRGRGRGGGPGSRGGRGAAAAAAAAAARDGEGGSTRGGGPGSRGGGITRKPRITKAERAQRELEKKQREQMAVLAAKPPNYQP